jgi:hypothetical protein
MPERVGFNEPLEFQIKTLSSRDISPILLSVEFANHSGSYVAAAIKDSSSFKVKLQEGKNCWRCKIHHIPLKAGLYFLILHLIDSKGVFLASEVKMKKLKVNGGHPGITADCQLEIYSWENA